MASEPSTTLFTNGTVFAVAAASDRTYVGGDFSLIGPATGSWVAIGSGGSTVPRRPPVTGSVVAATPDGHGGWFVAGTIAAVGAVARSAQVVHLRPSGALDPRWRITVRGGRVNALARRANVLFLGGSFATVDGKPRRDLAAVTVARGTLLPWRLRDAPQRAARTKGTPAASVSSLALARDGGSLYVAGMFERMGRLKRLRAAAVDVRTGRVTGWNPAPDATVTAIAPAVRGRAVYMGGYFTRIGGAARPALAAVDAGSGRSLPFNVHASEEASVYAVVPTATAVYLAGDFRSIGGKSRHLVAAVDPRSGAARDWDPSVSGDDVTALADAANGRTVYFGGAFSEVGGTRRDSLAAVDAGTGALTGWDPPALGTIALMATGAQGTVFVGGDIASVGAVRRPGLASFTADGSVTDWSPPLTGVVRSLALSPDLKRLYVGGALAPGDAPAQRNLAVVDVATGTLHAFGGGTSSGVWAIAPTADGSRVYIGGAFVTVAGKRRTRLAALDAATGELQAWNSGANDLVRALLPTADAVYAGGDFASAGGLPRARLVALDASTGAAMGWSPEPDDNVWSLALHEQTLFVGGEFTQLGGRTRNHLAAVDVESGAATSWDPNADETVRALRLSADGLRLYAAGEFEKVGRATRSYAEFSVANGSLMAWNPPDAFDGYSIAVAPGGSSVAIGGDGGVDVFR